MAESEKHKRLKECACDIFGGLVEKTVNGRVDVKTSTSCLEVETTARKDRIQRAIEKLSSSKCKGSFIIVPPNALEKTQRLIKEKDNIIPISSDRLEKICRNRNSSKTNML